MYIYIYAYIYIYIYIYMYACMYVCMYVYICIHFFRPGRSGDWRAGPRDGELSVKTAGEWNNKHNRFIKIINTCVYIYIYIYIYIHIIHIRSILHYKLVWSYASISLSPGSTRKLPASVNKRLFPFNCLSISYVWCCVAFVFACLCCLFIYIYIYIYTTTYEQ